MFIRLARPRDLAQVAEMVEESFGRHDEPLLIESLRKDRRIMYEWVATKSEELVGHLVMSRLRRPKHCLALGPVSVAPIHQREGIGSALINASLELAEEEEWVAVFVLGDPEYYERFGFDFARSSSFSTPYPQEFTGVAVLDEGGFSALPRDIEYPKAFAHI
jgi:putative acetyltransferase